MLVLHILIGGPGFTTQTAAELNDDALKFGFMIRAECNGILRFVRFYREQRVGCFGSVHVNQLTDSGFKNHKNQSKLIPLIPLYFMQVLKT